MKHVIKRPLFGALAFVFTLTLMLGVASASAQADSGTPTPQDPCIAFEATEATPSPAMEAMEMEIEFDLMFIDMMVPHHRGAIDMSEVLLHRSEIEEIRSLAEEIIAAQSAEIEQMNEWRESWYAGEPAMSADHANQMMQGMMGDSGMMGMDSGAMLADLCEAENVEVAFLELMIPHHQSAIAMAEAALEQAEHEEVRELAQVIIDSQSAEIETMQAMLASLTGTPVAAG